ncbi:hypothetical protein RHGRI_025468 [Rhododendron griersonianum]|uniref:Uncharacterized protein n=1 Tax=Rhododendron griersonianum TaxID=479676 RepID=A0AAV6IPF4_9ERIC|nr:hypothetical protein RHGRI_025468 [Rhododendron griersonianum]
MAMIKALWSHYPITSKRSLFLAFIRHCVIIKHIKALVFGIPPKMAVKASGVRQVEPEGPMEILSGFEVMISKIIVPGLAMNPQGFGVVRDCTDDGNNVLVSNAIIGISDPVSRMKCEANE